MLQQLYIKNYAIIDELTISFDKGLNIITGETGAGKSIMLGALSLILGDRADSSVLIHKDEKCIVEASFLTKDNEQIRSLLLQNDLDVDSQTIIRREISISGKSRAFINDTPVTLPVLSNITDHLVDLHRQFDNTALKDRDFIYRVVDALSNNHDLLTEYKSLFKSYQQIEQQILKEKEDQEAWQKEADYKQFLYEELEQAAFQEQEVETLEEDVKKMSHAEQIKSSLSGALYLLEQQDGQAINSNLKQAIQQLNSIQSVFSEAQSLSQRLESTWIELRDVANEIENLEQSVDLNANSLQQAEERLDLAYRLFKKHQVNATADLLQIQNELETDLMQHSQSSERLEALQLEWKKCLEQLQFVASQLFQKRAEQAPIFSEAVNNYLHLIGMPNAQMKVEVVAKENFNEWGKDQILLLWDANNSGHFQSLQKSASGGELSRIMLCIKTLTAKAMDLPTLIFDEVDTGISGEAARQVGILLKKLGANHQVMSITHQPQIAAKGHSHFYVYKSEKNGKITTSIRLLTEEERVQVLAQMIGGDQPTEAALKNAKELME